jgi:hypothetical protein
MRKLLCLLATAVIMLFAGSYVHGTTMTITQTGSWDVSQSKLVTSPMTYTNSVTGSAVFSQFNPALGTLSSVEVIYVDGVNDSRFYAENLSSQTESFTYNGFTTTGYAAAIGQGSPTFNEESYFGSGFYCNGVMNVTPNTDTWQFPLGDSGEAGICTQEYSNQYDLSAFIGNGTFDMAPRSEMSFEITSMSPDVKLLFELEDTATYEIDYIYEPIPEPATMMLIALGGLVLRKYRK